MTYFEAYLLTRFDSLKTFFNVLWTLSITTILIGLIIWLISKSEDEDSISKETEVVCFSILKKLLVPTLLAGMFIASLIPTTKEAAFIYIAPALVNNEDLRKTVKQIPEISSLGLEYLKETLKQETKEIINNKK